MPHSTPTPVTSGLRFGDVWPRLVHVYQKEIWQSALLKDRSLKGCSFAVLRVISITITVFIETRVAIRAAALGFSSLLGLGPLLAIATLVAGFAIGETDSRQIATKLDQLLKIVAPQLRQYEDLPVSKEAYAYLTQDEPPPDQSPDAGVTATPTAPTAVTTEVSPKSSTEKAPTPTMDRSAREQAPPSAPPKSASQNPKIVDVINKIIESARSGSAGAASATTLIFIVLLLFKSIEDTFNDIWGVRQGRSVLMRIVFYWTVLTLGAVLFFTAMAVGVKTFSSLFPEKGGEVSMVNPATPPVNKLGTQGQPVTEKRSVDSGAQKNETASVVESDLAPTRWQKFKGSLGRTVENLFRSTLPLLSFSLLAGVLTLFYRVIPNTRVFWRAALIGGLVVAALLSLNNLVAFLYVKRVVLEGSLYGSLALPLVLMSGLYIIWLCVLTGGIVSYAVQNVHFRNSQAAWSTLTHSTRERLALVVFLTICRRFRECLPPISASHLSEMLKVPTQLLNECLNRLVQLKLVATVRPETSNAATDYLYQPARPLNRITLFDFKMLDDNFGENPIGASLERIDPLLTHYDLAVTRLGEQEFFQKTVEQLFEEHPSDESRPPFAMGERVKHA